jgi:hypothetical protein
MGFVIGAIIMGAGMLLSANASNNAANVQQEGINQAAAQAEAQAGRQAEQDALLEEQRERYREFEFFNPYADLENPYANMQNMYAGMQNVYEDLTVSQQAARFQMEQGTQQRANIMQQMRGAAGGSGIAALAQSLAQQGTIQARQVSVDIAQQEATNQRLRAQGAGQIQQLERGAAAQLQALERQGLSATQMARAGGEMAVQEAEMQRQATLLGVAYQGAAGASAGLQQAYANQMQMQFGMGQIYSQQAGAYANMAGTVGGAYFGNPNIGSDRKLKKDIKRIGLSPSGLKIYSFKYIDKSHGKGTWQGVMSDEIPQYAVSKHKDGYDMVDYSMLDVEFKQL